MGCSSVNVKRGQVETSTVQKTQEQDIEGKLMKNMDASMGSSVSRQEAELVKELWQNFNEIDHPERKQQWLETIHREILNNSFCIPEDFDFSHTFNPDLIQQLRDRNYPCFDKTKEELINSLVQIYDDCKFISQYKISVTKLQKFFWTVANNYLDNPYHNAYHGFNVTQFIYYMMSKSSKLNTLMNDEEKFCLSICAVAHDVGHPGVNNAFLINIKDELAMRYNDISVLENHHASTLFKVLELVDCQILSFFSAPEKRALRKLMIQAILSTDMSLHGAVMTRFKETMPQFDYENQIHRQNVMDMVMHSADVSNPALSFDLAKQWSLKIIDEFNNQVVKEEQFEVPVSEFMRVGSTLESIKKNQGGFIGFMILPLFNLLCEHIPELQECADEVAANKKQWEELTEL